MAREIVAVARVPRRHDAVEHVHAPPDALDQAAPQHVAMLLRRRFGIFAGYENQVFPGHRMSMAIDSLRKQYTHFA